MASYADFDAAIVDTNQRARNGDKVRLKFQHGAPTAAITEPVLDVDSGVLYVSGQPGSFVTKDFMASSAAPAPTTTTTQLDTIWSS